MFRRTFLAALSGFAAAPALPMAAPAIPAAVAARHFTVASIIARAHNRCTPEMLAWLLRVSPEVAQQVQALLLDRGVITAPVKGAAMAVHPTNTNCIPSEAFRPSNIARRELDLKARLGKLVDDAPGTDGSDALPDDPDDDLAGAGFAEFP